MTAPQPPPQDGRNSAVVGALVFVVFNVAVVVIGVGTAGTRTGSLVRSVLFLGNLAIPVVALVKGWGRFAAGWALAIGILLVAGLGICLIALRGA